MTFRNYLIELIKFEAIEISLIEKYNCAEDALHLIYSIQKDIDKNNRDLQHLDESYRKENIGLFTKVFDYKSDQMHRDNFDFDYNSLLIFEVGSVLIDQFGVIYTIESFTKAGILCENVFFRFDTFITDYQVNFKFIDTELTHKPL